MDDHALIREGLKSLLANDPGFDVVAEAGDGDEALAKAAQERPEMLVLDISMPKTNGLQLASKLLEILPEARLCFLSMHRRPEYIVEAFHAGALGYVLKDAVTDNLLQALQTIARGEIYLDSGLSRDVLLGLPGMPSRPRSMVTLGLGALTAREREVLALVVTGLSYKRIAERLHISPKTARNHRENIMKKLDAHSAIDLTRAAIRLGLMAIED